MIIDAIIIFPWSDVMSGVVWRVWTGADLMMSIRLGGASSHSPSKVTTHHLNSPFPLCLPYELARDLVPKCLMDEEEMIVRLFFSSNIINNGDPILVVFHDPD
nr:hypothetical protein [Tanacetum cinerariifolium]